MQNIEFLNAYHFENDYHRVKPAASLAGFIDFFWETKFDHLWKLYPGGFSDVLFPNIGYTFIINLGTPYIMEVDTEKFEMKTDGYLPRHTAIECYHSPGNRLFGIKFKMSPEIFKTKINFSEYKGFIYPLSYLMEQPLTDNVKKAGSFEERVTVLNMYYSGIVQAHHGVPEPVRIVTSILSHCDQHNDFHTPIEAYAANHNISARTLHRHFEATTSSSSKRALQIMRIRKATQHLAASPGDFSYSTYGYYDHSHFYKHLKQFLKKETLEKVKPHLTLLAQL